MALLDGRYEEQKPKDATPVWLLVLSLAIPSSLILIALTGWVSRPFLLLPVVLLLLFRILSRRRSRRRH